MFIWFSHQTQTLCIIMIVKGAMLLKKWMKHFLVRHWNEMIRRRRDIESSRIFLLL